MTTTPLEQHRDANADASALAAIRERIAASGVEYLYYQGVTITGRVIGKVVPARHLLRNAERGVQLHRTAAADLQATRDGLLLGGGVEAAEHQQAGVLAVQWHPEDQAATCPYDQALFDDLVARARAGAPSSAL